MLKNSEVNFAGPAQANKSGRRNGETAVCGKGFSVNAIIATQSFLEEGCCLSSLEGGGPPPRVGTREPDGSCRLGVLPDSMNVEACTGSRASLVLVLFESARR